MNILKGVNSIMKWTKKDGCESIAEVIERNVGMPISEFLNPKPSPFITNLKDAADFIKGFARTEKVTVMGDYDCDGVTSSSILYKILKKLGFTDVTVRLPKRFSEGYGLSMKAIDEIPSGLLITVDNGIVAHDEIKAAKDKGLSVVIIDHHIGDEENLPLADVVVDPNALSGSEFSDYCAAGLALRLAEEMGIADDEMLALSAIGTVADVMPLINDNRRIVEKGLIAINEGKGSEGLRALLPIVTKSILTETGIGFNVGPAVNAAGRMLDDGAKYPFTLLSDSYTSIGEKEDLAIRLKELNEMRKEEVQKGLAISQLAISEDCLYGDNPMVIFTTDKNAVHEGVVGIIAGRLAESLKVPCFVLTETEPGILKGSVRSYGGVNVKELMDKVSHLIIRYGGHEGAGGLSIKKENMIDFREALKKEMEGIDLASEKEEEYYDLEIEPKDIEETIEELEKYAPFGVGNPRVVFKVKDYRLYPRNGGFYTTVGNTGTMIKLFGKGNEAISFDKYEKFIELGEPKVLNLYGTLSKNRYMYSVSNQVELADFEKTDIVSTETGLAALLRAKMTEM